MATKKKVTKTKTKLKKQSSAITNITTLGDDITYMDDYNEPLGVVSHLSSMENKITSIPEKKDPWRPTKFKPEFCQELIDYQSQGYSLEAFAGKIGVCTDTIQDWAKPENEYKYSGFSVAKRLAANKSRVFWEEAGMNGMNGITQGFGASVWIFNMKNRFKWRDNLDIETVDKTPKTDKSELANMLLKAISVAGEFE